MGVTLGVYLFFITWNYNRYKACSDMFDRRTPTNKIKGLQLICNPLLIFSSRIVAFIKLP